MTASSPETRSGRKKVPPERRFTERIVFRLRPIQYKRLARRAHMRGLDPNDYARDRALARVRPTRAQRRLAAEADGLLTSLGQFVQFAHALLPHVEEQCAGDSELGQVVQRARQRFPDSPSVLARLRQLIEDAAAT